MGNIYGHDQKETFFNNFNLHLIFRLNDPTTAEFLSRAFVEREVVKKFSSSQMSPTDLGDRISISEQEKLEKDAVPGPEGLPCLSENRELRCHNHEDTPEICASDHR